MSDPAITGTPVVGETLTTSSGTYTATPTSYSYQWKRGGSDIFGATSMFYTLVEADAAAATRGNITCQVTANFASGGPVVTLAAPTTMPRRTYPTLAIRTGGRTKVNHGGVNYNSPTLKCLGVGATDASNWTCGAATSGTDTHWNRAVAAGITPVPLAAGVSAQLNAGPYVFPVTATFADGLAETITLTITTAANVQTLAPRDGFGNATWTSAHVITTGAITAVEIATGSAFASNSLTFGGATTAGIRPPSLLILRDADLARPTYLAQINCQNNTNLQIDDLQFKYGAGYVPTNAGNHFTNATDPASTVTVNRMRVRGNRAYHISTNGVGSNTIRIGCTGTYNFNDCDFENIRGGFSEDSSSKTNGPVTVNVNRLKIRYFFADCFLIGGDNETYASTWNVDDAVMVAGFRAGTSTLHLDFLQCSNTGRNIVMNFSRIITADGDGTAQTQSNYTDSHLVRPHKMTCRGWLDAVRGSRGVSTSAGDNSLYTAITTWKCNSGTVATSSTENDGFVEQGPFFLASTRGTYVGTQVLSNSIFYGLDLDPNTYPGDAPAGGPFFTKTNVTFHGATGSAPPINSGFVVANPKAAAEALPYATMTMDQIKTALMGIFTPAAGGDYDLGGGAWRGAIKGDGSWNVA